MSIATRYRLKLLFVFVPIITLTSCDAMLHMKYVIENKSSSNIKLFVPNYPTGSITSIYSNSKDTTLILKSNEKIIVGIDIKIDFPWATKNIYKNRPGKCGLKQIKMDTTNTLGCTKSEWVYKRGKSILKLN